MSVSNGQHRIVSSSNGSPRRKLPISANRLAANRRNAVRSTGPRTAAGKKRSARNALKHGLCAREWFPEKIAPLINSPVLPGECAATFETIKEELCDEFHPRTASERWIINTIADQMWRLMRANVIERHLLDDGAARLARRRRRSTYHANGEDTVTAAQVMASLFAGESSAMMLLTRYQRALNSTVLRLFVRLQALRKRPNEDLYSWEERLAAKESALCGTFPVVTHPPRSTEHSHSNPPPPKPNPLQQAANAVPLPVVTPTPDETKPLFDSTDREADTMVPSKARNLNRPDGPGSGDPSLRSG
jgi:hypothetical protein